MGTTDLATKLNDFMEQMVARKSTLKEKMAKLSIVVTKASTRENSGETRNRRKNKGLGDNNILGEFVNLKPSEELRVDIQFQQQDNLGFAMNTSKRFHKGDCTNFQKWAC